MKKASKLLGIILILMMVVSFLMPLQSKAANYTYKVNIVLGGTAETKSAFLSDLSDSLTIFSNTAVLSVSDEDIITIEGLEYLDQITFDPKNAVAIDPDAAKYYVKGMRISGANTVISQSAFTVSKDETYVIAYGVGDVVPYTVKYLDDKGNVLSEDAVYYSALGEEVYIPYRYIDGYTPNAYNLHVESLGENQVFEFIYTKNTSSQTVYNTSTVTTYDTENGGTDYTYQTVYKQIARPDVQIQDSAGVINNRGEEANADAQNVAGDDAGISIEDTATPLGVEDVIDIEDEEVAKAIEADKVMETYRRYALTVLIVGIIVILSTGVSVAKERYDKKHKN